MIKTRDLVHLPYTPDLTEGGIIYARRVLPTLHTRGGKALYNAFQRTVAATALQLAFRRYLDAQGIEFRVRSARSLADPYRYEVAMGRRTCALKPFLISRQTQIDALAADPSLALRALALVPLDRYAADGLRGDDVYLFALVSAGSGDTAGAGADAAPSGNGGFWLHAMPSAWMRPQSWAPLWPLAVKSDSSRTLRLWLTGEDGAGASLDVAAEALPRQRIEVDAPLHSLSHVHVLTRPTGRIGIHSPSHAETYIIRPVDWHDVWLHGRDIWLLGWITREQFGMRAKPIAEGRRVFQFERTRTRNLAVGVEDLRPVPELLERARATVWKGLV